MPEVVQAELPLKSVPSKFIIPDTAVLDSDGIAVPKEKPAVAEAPQKGQNTGEQATPAKSEGEPPKEELTPEQVEERDRKRAGERFGRKLDKAYRQRAEAQARADLLERQLNEFKQAQSVQQQPKVEGEPTLAQFDYDPEKYAQSKAEFAKTQVQKEIETRQRTEYQKQETQRLLSSWEEKVARAEDKYDDFETIVGELQPTTPFIAALMEADNGEDIAYHLGKNPKEAERIAKLPPLAQVREIGKLEAKLSSKPDEPKTPSKAPAPITPLTGAAQPVSDPLSEDHDMKTWIRNRQKQVHKR